MKRVIVLAFGIGLLAAGAAWAGQKISGYPVSVGTNGHLAWGSMGAVRGSADSNEVIFCYTYSFSTGSPNGFCAAVDANGNSGSCSFTSPALIAAVQAIPAYSFIEFLWDSNYNCTEIIVGNSSSYAPMVP